MVKRYVKGVTPQLNMNFSIYGVQKQKFILEMPLL